ncbi:MAG: type II toxin-antitoxin system RelE/ParE family toxin [Chromatiales bacterium]|nr:type II toxin-antitoxin system RelE/ParE family toxin [Chromatiales bacterium]
MGKRCGVRTIIAFSHGETCFFIYGYEKNAHHNIATTESNALKLLGRERKRA